MPGRLNRRLRKFFLQKRARLLHLFIIAVTAGHGFMEPLGRLQLFRPDQAPYHRRNVAGPQLIAHRH